MFGSLSSPAVDAQGLAVTRQTPVGPPVTAQTPVEVAPPETVPQPAGNVVQVTPGASSRAPFQVGPESGAAACNGTVFQMAVAGASSVAQAAASAAVDSPPADGAGIPERRRQVDTEEGARKFFVSQVKGAYNKKENMPNDNGNCGPTCLTMAAWIFGRIDAVTPASANDAIERSRRLMGGNPDDERWEKKGVSCQAIVRAARAYGLDAQEIHKGRMDQLERATQEGRLGICLISPRAIGRGKSSGHFVMVRRVTKTHVYVSDPGRGHARDGVKKMSREEFERAWLARGGRAVLVGPPATRQSAAAGGASRP